MTATQRHKHNEGKCTHLFCRNDAAPQRTVCYKHRSQKYAERNPLRYTFNALRLNARRRNKIFTITFEDFQQFCIENDYMKYKGKNRTACSIDRIENSKGYEPGNIRMLHVYENCSKSDKPIHEYEPLPF